MKANTQLEDSRLPMQIKESLHGTLVPLAQICAGLDINAQLFQSMARKAFVDAAKARLAKAGEKVTVSRVALRCGLTRQETSILFHERPKAIKARPSAVSRIIERWNQHPRWRGKNGPLDLPKSGPKSFRTLCEECKVSGYSVRNFLDHLELDGNIEVLPDDTVRLIRLTNTPMDLVDKAVSGFQDVARLLNTIRRNLFGGGDPLFEQVSGSLNIAPWQRRSVIRMLWDKGRSVCQAATEALKKHESKGEYSDVGLGVYLYEQSEHDDKQE